MRCLLYRKDFRRQECSGDAAWLSYRNQVVSCAHMCTLCGETHFNAHSPCYCCSHSVTLCNTMQQNGSTRGHTRQKCSGSCAHTPWEARCVVRRTWTRALHATAHSATHGNTQQHMVIHDNTPDRALHTPLWKQTWKEKHVHDTCGLIEPSLQKNQSTIWRHQINCRNINITGMPLSCCGS